MYFISYEIYRKHLSFSIYSVDLADFIFRFAKEVKEHVNLNILTDHLKSVYIICPPPYHQADLLQNLT